MKLHKAEVSSRERHGDHVLLRYRWQGEFPEPGQFVIVRLAAALDPFLPRPFFVHDHEDGEASLLFEVRGRGTAFLAEDAKEMLVSAPLGRGFTLDASDGGGPVALVGGGVWVAPLKLLSRRLSSSGAEHRVFLEVPGTARRGYADLVFARYPGAELVPTEGTPDPPRAVLDSLGDLYRYSTLYVSGTTETLVAARAASAASGVPAQLALRERMACANGSCYGCAVPVWTDGEKAYVRACIEGPVFGARELAWENPAW